MIELLLKADEAMAIGFLDQAERLYRQAVDADPGNAIAVVGLARVALERGDARTSHSLAQAALRIDPENLQAQRIASRTADVLVARGEGLPEPAEGFGNAPPASPGGTGGARVAAQSRGTTAARAAQPRRGLLRRLFGGR